MKPSLMKYVLSPKYSLVHKDQLNKVNPKLRRLEKSNYLKTYKGEFYKVNDNISDILSLFIEPTTPVKVLGEYAELTGINIEILKPVVKTFLNDMAHEEIIVNEEEALVFQKELQQNKYKKPVWNEGQYIDDYLVLKKISLKKSAQIYLISKDNLSYAAKVLPFSRDKSTDKKEKAFRHEFNIMKDIPHHQNVCKFYEYQTTGEYPYAIMEYVEGITLRQFCSKEVINLQKILNVAAQATQGIAHLQSHGIIHGDIHLTNFLVNKDNVVKIIDFGLANRIVRLESDVYRNGAVHKYVPPERIGKNSFSFLGQRSTFASEVFQLGIIVYYLVYKELPFRGVTWSELSKNIKEQEPNFGDNSAYGFKVPLALKTLIKKALMKNPNLRFTDASEMTASILSLQPISCKKA